MIRITTPENLRKIRDTDIYPYIKNLLKTVLKEYQEFCPDLSIEEIGAIFLLEQETDWNLYADMGFSVPITQNRFEWIERVENGYCDGCIVINNDRAINIIGKQEYFMKFMEEFV